MAKESEYRFDVAVGWKYMPTDSLFGALFAKAFVGLDRDTRVPLDSIPKDGKLSKISS